MVYRAGWLSALAVSMTCLSWPSVASAAPVIPVGANPTWGVQPSAAPAGAINARLASVSCTAANAGSECAAVGDYDTSTSLLPMAEHQDGGRWTVDPVPLPADQDSGSLVNVSCDQGPTLSLCLAVGSYFPASGGYMPLAELWNGTAWATTPIQLPSGATGGLLRGVSCTASDACTAVGSSISRQDSDSLLIERWDGRSWTIQTAPSPSGSVSSDLSGVSCSSTSACSAVGNYTDTSDQSVTLAEQWNGTDWTVQTTPNPVRATQSLLLSVSCTSASRCAAVGYSTTFFREVPVAETWNGVAWLLRPTPDQGQYGGYLLGVSCRPGSTVDCTAVGLTTVSDSSSGQSTAVSLAEHWNGVIWRAETTPNPSGSLVSVLTGVDCAGPIGCVADGAYDPTQGTDWPLVESESTAPGGDVAEAPWAIAVPTLGLIAAVILLSRRRRRVRL